MVTLYHCADARSFRALWALEELGLPYELKLLHGGLLAVEPDQPAYGDWLNWLHRGEATLTFPQTLVLRYTRLEPKERRNPQVAEDYARWFMARLRSVDAALERADYLCAGRFTAADISVGYALLLARTLGLDERFSPAINAYWERLAGREAFQRAKAAQAAEGVLTWQG